MNIGDKIALHKVLFPDHPNQPPDEFTIVTISQKREDVPYMFGKGKGDGYRGTDEKGRMFELHWNQYPDDAATPHWLWHEVNWNKPYNDGSSFYIDEWSDLTQGNLLTPKLPEYFVGKDILDYCPVHKELYYLHDSITNGKCFHCWANQTFSSHKDSLAEVIKEIEEKNKTWKGW